MEGEVVSEPYIEQMLEEPRKVMVFGTGEEDLAREVLDEVVVSLAEQMQLSDPTLENLVILDSHTADEHWQSIVPGVQVASLSDITEGRFHLSKHMCIVAFGSAFLQRRVLVPFVKATRFYAAVKTSVSTRAQVERVHPLQNAVFLEGAIA